MDRGIRGLRRTLNILDAAELHHTGTYRSKRESQELLIRNVKGIRIGILSYTYGTNGISVPADMAWAVNRIRRAKMYADLRRLKRQADLAIVALHFGQEFHRYPNDKQKALVKDLFHRGADIVFDAHPHVLQPMALETVRDASGRKARRFVIYSLGNFISDRMMAGLHSSSGAIVYLTVRKDNEGVTLERVRTVPTWVHKYRHHGHTKFRVLPVGPYLKHPDDKLTEADLSTLKRVYATTTKHVRLPSGSHS